jgi:hypothetical protein
MEFLTRELARAVGLGGRGRKAASFAEQARVNATRRIKEAIRKIIANDPSLGRYLATTIKTGTFCSYVPDPRMLVSWEL